MAFQVVVNIGGKTEEVVFERVLSSIPDGTPRWQDVEIDLSGYAGREVELAFMVEASQEFSLWHGLPLWANPEIVSAETSDGPPNIVLLSLDTLRSDHLSLYDYPRRTSPSIDAWAARTATVFTTAVAPSAWTLPSHVSLFTGIDALHHGVNYRNKRATAGFTMLAEVLRAAGYTTAAVTGGGYLHPRFGFTQGFDAYDYWGHDQIKNPLRENEPEVTAGMDRALAFLESNADQPFFLFFHTYEVHSPYRRREPFFTSRRAGTKAPGAVADVVLGGPPRPENGFKPYPTVVWRQPDGTTSPISVDELVDLYDGGIVHADEQVGRLLERLRELDIEDDTIVVLTSDHGENLGEHGLFNHAGLYDEVLSVPLVVAYPARISGGGEVDTQVRLIDIAPTILDLAGLSPLPEADGASLLPLLETGGDGNPRDAWSYAAQANHGVSLRVDEGIKYIFNDSVFAPIRGVDQLYDLRADPREQRNLADASPRRREFGIRVREKLVGAPGFFIRFFNGGSEELSGTISGRAAQLLRLKSPDLTCDCVEWKGNGELAFRVPPASRFTLRVEAVWRHEDELRLTGGVDDAPRRFDYTLLPAQQGEWSVSLTDADWRVSEAPEEPPEIGIHAWWQGGVETAGSAPLDADPDLERQLKALGYIR